MAKPQFPHNLLKLHWHMYGNKLSSSYGSYDEFEETVRNSPTIDADLQGIFKRAVQDFPGTDPRHIAETSGFQRWNETKDNTFGGNLARGIAGRGAELAGGLVEVLDIALQEAGVADSEGVVSNFAQYLRDQDFNYEEWTSWEDVKKNPLAAFAYAFEKGTVSLPDMAAAALVLPVYATARTGEMAQERAENDGRTQPTLNDLPAAAVGAVVSAFGERFGVRHALGMFPKAKLALKEGINPNLPASASATDLAKELGQGVLLQAGIEGAQEAVENIATTAGTKRGLNLVETASAAGKGALVGGIFGGGINISVKSALAAGGKTQENQRAAKEKAEREANRHQSNVDLHQQVDDDLRTYVPARTLEDGMRVVVSRWDKTPEVGTVRTNKKDENLIDIIRDDGQPLLTKFDRSQEYDGVDFFSAEPEDEPETDPADVEQDEYRSEVNRVLSRMGDTVSQTDVEALQALKKDAKFVKLDEGMKNAVDDVLAESAVDETAEGETTSKPKKATEKIKKAVEKAKQDKKKKKKKKETVVDEDVTDEESDDPVKKAEKSADYLLGQDVPTGEDTDALDKWRQHGKALQSFFDDKSIDHKKTPKETVNKLLDASKRFDDTKDASVSAIREAADYFLKTKKTKKNKASKEWKEKTKLLEKFKKYALGDTGTVNKLKSLLGNDFAKFGLALDTAKGTGPAYSHNVVYNTNAISSEVYKNNKDVIDFVGERFVNDTVDWVIEKYHAGPNNEESTDDKSGDQERYDFVKSEIEKTKLKKGDDKIHFERMKKIKMAALEAMHKGTPEKTTRQKLVDRVTQKVGEVVDKDGNVNQAELDKLADKSKAASELSYEMLNKNTISNMKKKARHKQAYIKRLIKQLHEKEEKGEDTKALDEKITQREAELEGIYVEISEAEAMLAEKTKKEKEGKTQEDKPTKTEPVETTQTEETTEPTVPPDQNFIRAEDIKKVVPDFEGKDGSEFVESILRKRLGDKVVDQIMGKTTEDTPAQDFQKELRGAVDYITSNDAPDLRKNNAKTKKWIQAGQTIQDSLQKYHDEDAKRGTASEQSLELSRAWQKFNYYYQHHLKEGNIAVKLTPPKETTKPTETKPEFDEERLAKEAVELFNATEFPKGAKRATRIKDELEALRDNPDIWDTLGENEQGFIQRAIDNYWKVLDISEGGHEQVALSKAAFTPKLIKEANELFAAVEFPKGAKRATRIKNELEALRDDPSLKGVLLGGDLDLINRAIANYEKIIGKQKQAETKAGKDKVARMSGVPQSIAKGVLAAVPSEEDLENDNNARSATIKFLGDVYEFQKTEAWNDLSDADRQLINEAVVKHSKAAGLVKDDAEIDKTTAMTDRVWNAIMDIGDFHELKGGYRVEIKQNKQPKEWIAAAKVIKAFLDNAKLESLPKDEQSQIRKTLGQIKDLGLDINNLDKKQTKPTTRKGKAATQPILSVSKTKKPTGRRITSKMPANIRKLVDAVNKGDDITEYEANDALDVIEDFIDKAKHKNLTFKEREELQNAIDQYEIWSGTMVGLNVMEDYDMSPGFASEVVNVGDAQVKPPRKRVRVFDAYDNLSAKDADPSRNNWDERIKDTRNWMRGVYMNATSGPSQTILEKIVWLAGGSAKQDAIREAVGRIATNFSEDVSDMDRLAFWGQDFVVNKYGNLDIVGYIENFQHHMIMGIVPALRRNLDNPYEALEQYYEPGTSNVEMLEDLINQYAAFVNGIVYMKSMANALDKKIKNGKIKDNPTTILKELRKIFTAVYTSPGKPSELSPELANVFSVNHDMFSEAEAEAFRKVYIDAIDSIDRGKKDFYKYFTDNDVGDGYKSSAIIEEIRFLVERISETYDIANFHFPNALPGQGGHSSSSMANEASIFVSAIKAHRSLNIQSGQRVENDLSYIHTAAHELMHHLRSEGFLTKDEWNILKKEVDEKGLKKKLEAQERWGQNYASRPDLEEMLYEEPIAEMFGDFARKHYAEASLRTKTGKEYQGKETQPLREEVKKIFAKIIAFIDALMERYRLTDKQRAKATNTELVNEIFAEIMLGNVGKRSKSKPAQKLDLWWSMNNTMDRWARNANEVITPEKFVDLFKAKHRQVRSKAFSKDYPSGFVSTADFIKSIEDDVKDSESFGWDDRLSKNMIKVLKMHAASHPDTLEELINDIASDKYPQTGDRSGGDFVGTLKKPNSPLKKIDDGVETPKQKKKPDYEPFVTFADSETEARFRAAQEGVVPDSAWVKTKNWWQDIRRDMTRHFKYIDRGSAFNKERQEHARHNALLIEKLRHLEAAPDTIINEVQAYVNRLTNVGMDKAEFDLFTRAVVMRDLNYEAEMEAGRPLPFKLTAEQVPGELAKITRAVAMNPKVTKALIIRDQQLEYLRGEMIKHKVIPESRLKNIKYFRHEVMDYAKLKYGGQAKPKKVARGEFHKRRGSEKDINANYYQVETEYMIKAMDYIEKAKFLNWNEGSKYNYTRRFKKRAIEANRKAAVGVLRQSLANGMTALDEKSAAKMFEVLKGSEGLTPSQLSSKLSSALSEDKQFQKAYRKAVKEDAFAYMHQFRQHQKKIYSAMQRLNGLITAMPDEQAMQIPDDILKEFRMALGGNYDAIYGEDAPNIFKLYSWLVNQKGEDWEPYALSSLGLMKQIHARKEFLKGLAGEEFVNPESAKDLLEKYGGGSQFNLTLWQPDSRDKNHRAVHIYTKKTITEHVFDRVAENVFEAMDEYMKTLDPGTMADNIDWTGVLSLLNSAKDMQVIGGLKEQWIIPDYLADTLNEFRDNTIDNRLTEISFKLTTEFKKWMLFSPWRIMKYTLNNFSGDTDATWGNPSNWGTMSPARLKQAHTEIIDYMYRAKEPTKRLREAIRMGVIQSNLTAQDIPGKAMRQLESTGDIDFKSLKIKGDSKLNFYKGWFNTMIKLSSLREAGIRYASYLNYHDKFIKQGLTPQDIGYGATPPWMIDGLQDENEYETLAALMARDAMGDYANMSVAGRSLSRHFVMFWRWMESNARRYGWLGYNNLYAYAKYKWQNESPAAGVLAAAKSMSGMLAFSTLIFMWNNHIVSHFLGGDEDESLYDDDSWHLRVVLPFGPNDERWQIRLQGALSDMLGWLNLEDVGSIINSHQKGLATAPDILKTMALAPPNRMAQALNPIYKVPMELFLVGGSFFPDAFEPTKIRDNWTHAFRTFSLHREFQAVAKSLGYPISSKPYFSNFPELLVHRKDKKEMAYDRIRSKAYEWKVDQVDQKKKTNLMWHLQKAKRNNDEKAVRIITQKLIDDFGTTKQNFDRSDRSRHPLAALREDEIAEFLATLDPIERQFLLRQANEYYYETFRSRR